MSRYILLVFSPFLFTLIFFNYSTAQQYPQDTFLIKGQVTDKSTGNPLPQTNIIILGTLIGTSTNEQGEYQINIAPGDYEMLIRYVGYRTLKEKISISDKNIERNLKLERDLIEMTELVVIGTRTSDRTLIESLVPLDIIQYKEIEIGGLTETNQIIEMLVPSFNFPRASINDGTDHVRPATLRGLSPDHTLVLVNGFRRHPSALLNVQGGVGHGTNSVDLNTIPPNAIERIEILRDGASAQYGSDAIAGVINVILKSRLETRLSATIGQTKQGDGEVVDIQGNYGFTFGDAGFFNLSGEYRHRGPTNRSGPDARQQYFSIVDTLPDGTIKESLDPRELTFNRINHWYGDSKANDLYLLLNSSFPISSNMLLFSFGSANYREGEAGGFYRRSLDDRNIRSIYPDGFLPLIKPKIFDASLAVGLKGTLSKWIWNFNNVWGLNSFNFNVDNSVNVSMGTNSPTSFDCGNLVYQHLISSLDILNQVNLGFYSPVNVALGVMFRLENYQIEAGEEASYINGGVPILDGPNVGNVAAVGAQVFPGYRPSDECNNWRNNLGFYIDLESHIIKNFLLGIAGRFENYSDFGSTANGKLAFRFAPVNILAFRGTISSGFKAPSMAQINYSSTYTSFRGSVPYEIRSFPSNDPIAQILGAEDLNPEKSINLSLGIVTNPFENISLTIDYYRIYLKDRIALSNTFLGEEVREILEENGIFGVNGGQFFTNAIDTRTQGIDVVFKAGIKINKYQDLTFTSGLNLTKTLVTRVSDTPPELEEIEQPLIGRFNLGLLEDAQPNHRLMLLLSYKWDMFSVLVRTNWFGAITLRHWSDPEKDPTFGSKWVTDIEISYSIGNDLNIAFGSNNIFNVYPDIYYPDSAIDEILPYESMSPFGFNGAFYYTRFSIAL